MATKFELQLAITRLTPEKSPRFLRLTGGFRGLAIEGRQSNSTAIDPGCHSNEMWVEIGYKSARMTDISNILASTVGFQRRVIERCQSNSSTSDPGCHYNEN